MISLDEAFAKVIALAGTPRGETVALADAYGRAMIEPAVARLTQPPFDAAAMDGYALRAAELGAALPVVGEAAAGHPFTGDVPPGTAIRIFTGAPVPSGLDRVVMQENVTREGEVIRITDPSGGSNIRPRGGDFAEGDRVKPRRLTAADIGLLAAMNVAQVTVAAKPVVAILASGDELVRPGEELGAGQIVSSNDLTAASQVTQAGGLPRLLPIARDSEAALRDVLAMAEGADLIVTIGGASVGDHDLVGKVAASMGLERSFYKLAMRPGKPLMAGRLGGVPMLGLPGNPVSAYVCGMLFMQPLIRAMQGLDPTLRPTQAPLTTPLRPEGDRTHYLRARLTPQGIAPFEDQDSAKLSILAQADALLIRPAHDPAREPGDMVDYLPLDRR